MPAAKKQLPKTTTHRLNALEDHLSTLVPMVAGLHSGDAAFCKDIATKLRLLICGSSGQKGLLWELQADVGGDDLVLTRVGAIDTSNPLTNGLVLFDTYKLLNLEETPCPLKHVSLQRLIAEQELAFVDGKSVTYREVIKEMAEHSGTAHEAPGVSLEMAQANAFSIGNVHPYLPMLDRVARWTWSVGEAVLSAAVAKGHVRRRPPVTPPPAINLEARKFSFPMDGPKPDSTRDPGSLVVALEAQRFADAKSSNMDFPLPGVTYGGVVFSFTATRRGKLRIRASGLLVPNFGCECAVNANTSRQVMVGVTWKGLDVRVYVNGIQVQGSSSKNR
jgi:hypothetical protein